jgi:hypothetical protein
MPKIEQRRRWWLLCGAAVKEGAQGGAGGGCWVLCGAAGLFSLAVGVLCGSAGKEVGWEKERAEKSKGRRKKIMRIERKREREGVG